MCSSDLFNPAVQLEEVGSRLRKAGAGLMAGGNNGAEGFSSKQGEVNV